MLNPFHAKHELIVHSKTPFNAEPALARLRADFITSQKDYLRSSDVRIRNS